MIRLRLGMLRVRIHSLNHYLIRNGKQKADINLLFEMCQM